MAVVIDNLLAYKVLYMLVTPFVDTDAYKLGIIDENGTNLIKPSKFTSGDQKDAYTYLHRLVFNMKKILSKLPGGDNKLKSIVAALYLIKEYHQAKDKSYSLMEDRYNSIVKTDAVLVEEQIVVMTFLEHLDETTKSASYKLGWNHGTQDEFDNKYKNDSEYVKGFGDGSDHAASGKKGWGKSNPKTYKMKEDAPANATGAGVSTDQTVVKQKDVDKYKLKNAGALKFVKRN